MFAEKATLYDENCDFQYRMGVSLMDNDLKPKDGDCMLDLGCGTGRLATRLASKVGKRGKVVGVDPNAGRIQLARKNALHHNSKTRFVVGLVGDAASLGPYDGIFCNFVLHWVPDGSIQETLKDALDCLKPGGKLCAHIALSTGALLEAIERLVTGNDSPAVRPSHIPGQGGQDWSNMCELAGFDVSVAAEESTNPCWDNVDTCINVVRAYTDAGVTGHAIGDDDVIVLMKAHNIQSRADNVLTESKYLRLIAQKPAEV
ncbi:uncharacterized protein LOC135810536 [Sycon ciliatum]|uniref:uncharacterized protein LOC135810536 n=1 Tax=Sycon ciliatum TaxID=27933 RepID=UPI0031F63997